MKKKITGILVLVLVVLSVGVGCTVSKDESFSIYKDGNQLSKTLKTEDEKYLVYFTSKKCSFCNEIEPYITTQYKRIDGNIMPFYIVNTEKEENKKYYAQDENERYESVTDIPEDVTIENFKIVGTPELIMVENGKVVELGIGRDEIEKIIEKIK